MFILLSLNMMYFYHAILVAGKNTCQFSGCPDFSPGLLLYKTIQHAYKRNHVQGAGG